MTEKRRYDRYQCKLKTKFQYYIGNPEEIDTGKAPSKKGKGTILDISVGGVFIVTNDRVGVGMPIMVNFSLQKNKCSIHGKIVRTGLLKNNPSELAQKYYKQAVTKESYVAVEFSENLEELSEEMLK